MDQEEHKQQYMEVYIDFQKKVLPHPHKSPTPELFSGASKFHSKVSFHDEDSEETDTACPCHQHRAVNPSSLRASWNLS